MTTKFVCTACNGRKTLINMGMMRIECNQCEGKGYVVKDTVEPKKVVEVSIKPISKDDIEEKVKLPAMEHPVIDEPFYSEEGEVFKKKRGRPPVNKD